jgi:hypothetical protein
VTSRGAWRSPELLALACLLALHVGLAALMFDPMPSIGGDDARYMALAEALGSGLGYRDVHRPGQPLHEFYPPLYPALLALVRSAGGGIVAYKALSVACSTASVALAFLLARGRLAPAGALAFAAAWALSRPLLMSSHEVLTEALFVALVLAALAAAERPQEQRAAPALAIAAAVLAYATRSAGLALLAALPLAWCLERRFAAALAAAAAGAVAVAAWAAWGAWVPDAGDPGYLDVLLLVDPYAPERGQLGSGEVVARALQNLWSYASRSLPDALAGRPWPAPLALTAGGIVLALALWAAVRARRPRAVECFAACYLGLLLLWSGRWVSVRYLLPLLPCLLLLAMQGVAELAGSRRALVPAAGLLLALLALPGDLGLAWANRGCLAARARQGDLACYSRPYRAYFELARWAGEHLPRDAVVISRKPHSFSYFSGLQSDVYPFTSDQSRLLAFLEEVGATHVVVDTLSSTTSRFLVPAIRAVPGRFVIVKRLGSGPHAPTLLEYHRDASTPGGGSR